MQKARRQPFLSKRGIGLRPFVSYWFQNLFHSPNRSSFHLSLAVLVHYRSSTSIKSWRVVPPDSDRVSRVRPYLGTSRAVSLICIRGYHPVSPFFPESSALIKTCPYERPCNPESTTFGLDFIPFRSPLLRKSRLIYSPPPTEMFQFGGFSVFTLCIQIKMTNNYIRRVPPFGYLRIITPSGSPKLNAGSTSFFACRCQGIRQ
jgi:hypothetical protein